jgi:glycolate oxidase
MVPPQTEPPRATLGAVVNTSLLSGIESIVGHRGYLHRPEDLMLYSYDGSQEKGRPDVVVFPQSTAEVVRLVKLARAHDMPVLGRGAGTGLSGGAIARHGGVMICFARMNRIVEVDLANQRAVVEPGVVNLDLSLAVQPYGYFYAPDPSSQRACTIGGNVAENAGGPHTLAYGVTTNHVLGLEAVLPDGTIVQTGATDAYDLTGLLTGSEGTLALVTRIEVRLIRLPEAVKTILAIYDRPEDAGDTVTEITARAITPVAVEMLDGVMLRMVEEATHAGYPMDAAAVLLIELEGLREQVEEQTDQIREACMSCRAREFRVARSQEERDLLWKGRKNAFGAIGRVSPSYYVQDGVVPRTRIADTLRHIGGVGRDCGLTISNIFHAGDGNMHPIILFNARVAGEFQKAIRAGEDILRYCVSVGGSITGEHGVGMEKMSLMTDLFSRESLDMMQKLKELFDPELRLNPGKVLPLGKGCLEIRQRPLQAHTSML